MTTRRKKDLGTFAATGSSNKVRGKKVLVTGDVGAGTSVEVRQYPPGSTTAIVLETKTADFGSQLQSPVSVDWDLNCSVYGASTPYTLSASND